jgi:hypothetical protein
VKWCPFIIWRHLFAYNKPPKIRKTRSPQVEANLSHLIYGVVFLLAGLALIAASIAFGRALLPYFRAGQMKSGEVVGFFGLITAMVVSFMIGEFLCWAGVNTFVGG